LKPTSPPWGSIAGLAVSVAAFAVCQVLLPGVIYLISEDLYSALSGRPGPPRLFEQSASPLLQGLQQVLLIGIVLLVAGARGARRREVLHLGPPSGGSLSAVNLAGWTFLAMIPVYILISAIQPAHLVRTELSSKAWLMAYWPWLNLMTSIIGAPVSEEMLCRGYLLSSLSSWRFGLWGAAVASALFWSLMHQPWTWGVILPHVILGLLLSFLIYRTRSLWPCVLAHAINNTVPALLPLIYMRN
jgi:membrane protease YdiL (CAAX protease family)